MIAMPTIVTMLIPDNRRDRANGLVGTSSGISFLVTSVISGLLVGASGMLAVLVLALVVLPASVVHLSVVSVPERKATHAPTVGTRSMCVARWHSFGASRARSR